MSPPSGPNPEAVSDASEWEVFLKLHEIQLTSSGVPRHFWPKLLFKLKNQRFDVGNVVRLLKVETDPEIDSYQPDWVLQTCTSINKDGSENVFLIDHAWTFRLPDARAQLNENEKLRTRLSNILNINFEENAQNVVDQIIIKMWNILHSYSVKTDIVEESLPIWYVMDEVGSALMQNCSPNCRVLPFFYVNNSTTYSILFPIENILEDDFLSIDYSEGITDENQRKAFLYLWFKEDLDCSIIPEKPDNEYFFSGHIKETLPLLLNFKERKSLNREKLKVFTEYSVIRDFLTDPKFEIIDYEESADVLWYTKHFKNFLELSKTPQKFVNQYPYEYVITVKDLLSIICRNDNVDNCWPNWLPITYNLKTESCNFITYYNYRQSKNLDNYWITKPFNLSRGMFQYITNNLNAIIRISQTLPMIVQKYITKPVLFYRPECDGLVKFDIRYVILLKSTNPLKVYIYKKFFLRFANVPFGLTDFDDYEKHFTVMNYNENANLCHMLCDEFIEKFETQYTTFKWKYIENKICSMLHEIMLKATSNPPPQGIAESPQSRALYAADIMLEWSKNNTDIIPKILEINWTPDCKRACQYYPP